MKVVLEKALSLYLTGSADAGSAWNAKLEHCPYSKDELAELEIDWEASKDSFKFKEPVLNLHADWESFPGYIRNASLSMFDSLFSGVGAAFASRANFLTGISLASLSFLVSLASSIKKIPFLSTNFSLFNYGGRLLRSVMHFFDSIFSRIGEKGACFNLPTVVVSAASIFSLQRVLKDKDSKNIEMPITTIGGTLGRTAIHHLESMLSSKAAYLSSSNHFLSSFFASSLATFGLLMPEKIKNKQLPWQTLEGMISQTGFHFLDSIFSNVGTSFAQNLFTGGGLLISSLLLGLNQKIWNYKVPFPQFEGKLFRSIFHGIEAVSFNLGSRVGNSNFGTPLSLGFSGLTFLSLLANKNKNLIKNFKIPMNTVGGLVQRLPFDFIYSMISASGAKLSKLIPAPVLLLLGPLLSFQLGEKLKNASAKYDEFNGLLIRNAVHLWESILSGGAYRFGKSLISQDEDSTSSGSLLADGRWLTNDGRIVPTMAIGKQSGERRGSDLFTAILSLLSGVVFGVVGYAFTSFQVKKSNQVKQASMRTLSEHVIPAPAHDWSAGGEKAGIQVWPWRGQVLDTTPDLEGDVASYM